MGRDNLRNAWRVIRVNLCPAVKHETRAIAGHKDDRLNVFAHAYAPVRNAQIAVAMSCGLVCSYSNPSALQAEFAMCHAC